MPWSQVRVRRRKAGRPAIGGDHRVAATASAPWSPGRWSSITKRVVRSTRVPIAVGVAGPHHQVAFPVAGHGPVVDLGWAVADQDHVLDPLPRRRWSACRRGLRSARPVRRQAGQLAAEPAAALDVQRLVDRLVRHPHLRIVGKVLPQPSRDLLGAVFSLSRAWTSRRSRRFTASFAGRARPPARALWSARCWAVLARYRPREPALRRSSRLIVDGLRPSTPAIARIPAPAARRHAISSRSASASRPPSAGSDVAFSVMASRHQIVQTAAAPWAVTRRSASRHRPPRDPQPPAPRTPSEPPPAPADAPSRPPHIQSGCCTSTLNPPERPSHLNQRREGFETVACCNLLNRRCRQRVR